MRCIIIKIPQNSTVTKESIVTKPIVAWYCKDTEYVIDLYNKRSEYIPINFYLTIYVRMISDNSDMATARLVCPYHII